MTELLYLKDQLILECECKVAEIDCDKKFIIFDKTPFYPQGGGQQSDIGTIQSANDPENTIAITSVKKSDDVAYHYFSADFDKNPFSVGDKVICRVDSANRMMNSRAHSGGHLIDHASEDLELPFVPLKAYHFVPSPYVEYEVKATEGYPDFNWESKEDLEKLRVELENKVQTIVSKSLPVIIYDSLIEKLPPHRQSLLPVHLLHSGGVARMIKIGDYEALPCGGTHVTNTSQIGPIKIKKIGKIKPGGIRVVYQV